MKMTCKSKSELPSSFRDLGMQENIAAIFDAAGMTPKNMIDKARKYGIDNELARMDDGRFHLAVTEIRDEETLIPTGLEAKMVIGNPPGGGIGWTHALDAGHLRVNFYQVGIPYLSDYIREDAREQFKRIRREFYLSYLHGTFYVARVLTRRVYLHMEELCLKHYDVLENIHADPNPTIRRLRQTLKKNYRPECLASYNKLLAEARKSKEKKAENYDDSLMSILRDLSGYESFCCLAEKAFFVKDENPKQNSCE